MKTRTLLYISYNYLKHNLKNFRRHEDGLHLLTKQMKRKFMSQKRIYLFIVRLKSDRLKSKKSKKGLSIIG